MKRLAHENITCRLPYMSGKPKKIDFHFSPNSQGGIYSTLLKALLSLKVEPKAFKF